MGRPAKTAQDIVTWAEQRTPAESPSYTRLTDADRLTILTLHDKNVSQSEIARRLSRSVSTINEVIQTYLPTIDMAKRKLQASALRMAENVVENGQARDHVKTLEGLGVLQATDGASLTVIINGLTLAGTGRPETVDGEVLSPPQLEGAGESAENG